MRATGTILFPTNTRTRLRIDPVRVTGRRIALVGG